MSVRIDKDKCIGCGKCINICPGNLIKKSPENKAYLKHPRDCWGCTSCLKECPTDAVLFFLGADIGGLGSTLSYHESGGRVKWTINFPDGRVREIEVDPTQSNKY